MGVEASNAKNERSVSVEASNAKNERSVGVEAQLRLMLFHKIAKATSQLLRLCDRL